MMLNVFRQILIWLLIVAAVSLAVDYLRRPALPQNFSSMPLQTLDGRTVDLAAMSHERPLLLYVWATWCGVCRYTTPSVAALANDGGNVMTVALRSGFRHAAQARQLADVVRLFQPCFRVRAAAPRVPVRAAHAAASVGAKAAAITSSLRRVCLTAVSSRWR